MKVFVLDGEDSILGVYGTHTAIYQALRGDYEEDYEWAEEALENVREAIDTADFSKVVEDNFNVYVTEHEVIY